MTAVSIKSSAPRAIRTASSPARLVGLTRIRLSKPMFFIILATAPMLPA
jgi:hypothetical protein